MWRKFFKCKFTRWEFRSKPLVKMELSRKCELNYGKEQLQTAQRHAAEVRRKGVKASAL